MRKILTAVCLLAAIAAGAQTTVKMSDYGIKPGKGDVAGRIAKALTDIAKKTGKSDVTLVFEPGTYNFYPEKAASKTYFISNHDQPNPKAVGIDLDGWTNLTIEGNGADFMFHGRMLPVALVNSRSCTLRGFSIDFAIPHITQATVVEMTDSGMVFRPEPWTKCRVDKSGRFIASGHGWENTPSSAIAFDPDTRQIIYRTSDIYCPLDKVVDLKNGTFFTSRLRDARLKPGTKLALRSYMRPAPGVFLAEDVAPRLENVKVHYAEGMGLLAQLCDSVSLDGFGVCLRGDSDPRYVTTQADATHFSGCKGHIDSRNGLYENMTDDAINVHGTYLKVVGRPDDRTLIGRYMHGQSYGFKWGEPGDTVQFVMSRTMELAGTTNVIAAIEAYDKDGIDGAKEMKVTFTEPVDPAITPDVACGMENLAWTPSVTFDQNIIRNNRARGTLFSTPRKVVVSRNLFDHTAGSAILLCGDCNGWYETGACRDVLITDNTFVNPLTSMYQFTEAAISIYPEIPDLASQVKYFHGRGPGSIVIEGNRFAAFDKPLLYAKSVDGLVFRNNTVTTNIDFPAFHSNRFTFKFQRVRNAVIENNNFDRPDEVSFDIE